MVGNENSSPTAGHSSQALVGRDKGLIGPVSPPVRYPGYMLDLAISPTLRDFPPGSQEDVWLESLISELMALSLLPALVLTEVLGLESAWLRYVLQWRSTSAQVGEYNSLPTPPSQSQSCFPTRESSWTCSGNFHCPVKGSFPKTCLHPASLFILHPFA